MNISSLILLLLLSWWHMIADYTPFCNQWMCKAKEFWEPLFPILIHAFIHAIGMGTILLLYSDKTPIHLILIIKLFFLQWITHFLIDTIKWKINYYFPSVRDTHSDWYRIVFGWDQYLHTVIIIMMVYYYSTI